jgi:hypothetical protein
VGDRNNASISEAGKRYLANFMLAWISVLTLAPVAPPTGQVEGSILKNGGVNLPNMVEVIIGTVARAYSNEVTVGGGKVCDFTWECHWWRVSCSH